MISRIIALWMSIVMVQMATAAQCDTNPCQLGGDFVPPNYQCLQSTVDPNNAICTCPDGQTRNDTACRICDTVYCGATGVCIEKQIFEGLYYACACTSPTGNFISIDPCPNGNPTTTPPSTICLNGGTYNFATGTCACLSGYTGSRCETALSTGNCQNVVCANGGVCNPNPTYQNGVEIQCNCQPGFSGANCEIIGTLGQCTVGLCRNNGVCEEQVMGLSTYAFCRCPAGFTGRCCQTPYFQCPLSGVFADPINCKFGRYFQCSGASLNTLTCPRGLRYNFMKMQCDSDVSCPP